MTSVAYITNASPQSGVGYRAAKIQAAISALMLPELTLTSYEIDGVERTLKSLNQTIATQPALPGKLQNKTVAWWYLGRALRSQLRKQEASIWHATNQSLSFITHGHHPTVVTVHDIIELLDPQSRFGAVAARYLYRGIKTADHIIAVSLYTAKTIQEAFAIPAAAITVIPNGVDSDFHPIADFNNSIGALRLRQELGIQPDQKIVLAVSSDHPRKNTITTVHAFALALQQNPRLILIKVGEPGLPAGREMLLAEIDRLNIRQHVRIINSVSHSRLNELYNVADVFIYPSLFEGFGLPPLQAMAAGTPVITSNATSLPEVVGDAAIIHGPDDDAAFAASIARLTQDKTYADNLRAKGVAQAQRFSWESAAQAEVAVYKKISTNS